MLERRGCRSEPYKRVVIEKQSIIQHFRARLTVTALDKNISVAAVCAHLRVPS